MMLPRNLGSSRAPPRLAAPEQKHYTGDPTHSCVSGISRSVHRIPRGRPRDTRLGVLSSQTDSDIAEPPQLNPPHVGQV